MQEFPDAAVDYWHRALDAQAWTDLVSNITSLMPPTVEDDPRPWLGWGGARPENLSVFLHEATHHWCFMSPVAFAIAGLTLRARLHMVRVLNGERHLEHSIVNDLVRADTALELLRPLAEGLALFAEFDAISRIRSKAISPVLQSLVQFFVDPRRGAHLFQNLPAEAAVAAAIGEVLYDLRTNPVTMNRKASLLLKPFSMHAGGYLPGYLAVKSLWRAASRKRFLLASETDSFLMYLRSYIYDDWGFVATLLSEERNEIRSAEAILNYLNRRINDWDHLTEQDFAEYETSVAGDRGPNPPMLAGLRVEAGAAGLGRQRLGHLTQELAESRTAGKSMTTAIGAWNISILERRQLMNLASAPVTVCETAAGLPEIQWHGGHVFTPDPSDFIADGRCSLGNAQLEVIFELRGDRFERAAVVHRGSELLICAPVGLKEYASETRQTIRRAFVGRPLVLEAERKIRDVVEQVVRESWVRVSVDHCRSQVEGTVAEFFKDVSLRFARDYDAADSCARSMSQRGVLPILRSSSLVKGLALLGLATSLNPEERFVKGVFERSGLSLSQTLDELEAAYGSHGYPPRVLRAQNTLFSTV